MAIRLPPAGVKKGSPKPTPGPKRGLPAEGQF